MRASSHPGAGTNATIRASFHCEDHFHQVTQILKSALRKGHIKLKNYSIFPEKIKKCIAPLPVTQRIKIQVCFS